MKTCSNHRGRHSLSEARLLPSVAQAQKTSAGFRPDRKFFKLQELHVFRKHTGRANPFVNDMIMTAVVRELTARGLTKVDANPDLRVAYLAATGF